MISTRYRFLFAAVLVSLLAACSMVTLVETSRQTVGEGVISVEPGTVWNRMAAPGYQGRVEVWTQDGLTLNMLAFLDGVRDGESLFRRVGDTAESQPVFRATMNSIEIMELFRDTLTRATQSPTVELGQLKPATLGKEKGFRFTYRALHRDEVWRDGQVVGAVRGGRLYAVWFSGTGAHYYKRYQPEVERIVASLSWAQTPAPVTAQR
jgi:hypothetical protein